MEIKTALTLLLDKQNLTSEQMRTIMQRIMTGGATPAQIGGFLIALRCKGESIDEIAAAAQVMRELAEKVDIQGSHIVDTCGTGGDGANTFNISTTVAFIVAAAGGKVAKHGNRSVSSSSGSADVLEAAGVNINLNAQQVAHCVEQCGIGFLFAPQHHSAMKHAINPRRELAVRTIFNLLGPLSNPASAPNQLIGVYDKKWLLPMAEVLKKLGSKHVLIAHAADGLDEISIAADTYIAELQDGRISNYSITPEQFGLTRSSLQSLAVNSAQDSLLTVKSVLHNAPGPARDIVLMNAGAALYAAGLADSIATGISKSAQLLADGSAYEKLQQLISVSQELG